MHWSYPAVISAACEFPPSVCFCKAPCISRARRSENTLLCLNLTHGGHRARPSKIMQPTLRHSSGHSAAPVSHQSRLSQLLSRVDILSLPLGMAFMRNRRPMKLKRFAAAHNAFLFSLSLYMSVECIRQASDEAPSACRAVSLERLPLRGIAFLSHDACIRHAELSDVPVGSKVSVVVQCERQQHWRGLHPGRLQTSARLVDPLLVEGARPGDQCRHDRLAATVLGIGDESTSQDAVHAAALGACCVYSCKGCLHGPCTRRLTSL